MKGSVMSLVRLRQVHDGQHHENEGLQRDHQDVETCPHHAQHQLADGAADAGKGTDEEASAEHGEQQEDDLAREKVAVKTQAERHRASQVLDEVQQQVERHHPLADWGREQLPGEAAEAFDLEAVEHHDQEHGDRQAERDVEIGGRYDLQVLEAESLLGDQREKVHGNVVHEVEQQDPAEDGQCQGSDQLAVAVEGIAHLRIDELDHHLDEILELARYAGGGLSRHHPERNDEDQSQQHREEN